MKIYSLILLAVQFLAFGYIVLSGPVIKVGLISMVLELTAVIVGLWAAWSMRKSHFQPIPNVSQKASLVTDGPYKLIRHPMYTSILLFCFGLVFNQANIFRIITYTILIVDLTLKAIYEEKLLISHFKPYKHYMQSTKRFLPYIF